MMTHRYDAALLDADFALKIGEYGAVNLIEDVLSKLVRVLLIHKHVYDNEILIPQRVKDQIDQLIACGKLQIVDRTFIDNESPLRAAVYDDTVELLRSLDGETKELRKNWGEIVSLAVAKSLNIPLFLSDESGLQKIIDEHLNIGANGICVFRILDFIQYMKETGEDRKAAMWVWINSSNRTKQTALRRKVQFQNEIWPVSISQP